MSTALAPVQTAYVIPSAADLDARRNYAALLSRFEGLPQHYFGKPQAVLWAMARADADDMPLATFMDNSYPLPGGRIGTYALYKLGLAKLRVPDFNFQIIERSDQRCILEGWRGSGERVRLEYGVAQAAKRGLMAKETYQKSPSDMFFNRCGERLVKAVCADALLRAPSLFAVEADDDDTTAPAPKPASGAEVVEDAAPTPAAPPPAAPVSQAIPEDWLGRLLTAIREQYNIKAGVPGPLPGRNKWLKAANGDGKVLRLLNLFYEAQHEPPIDGWIAVPPMDYERIALWLEAEIEKRVGAEGSPSGGTDAAPTQSNQGAGNAGGGPASAPAGEVMASPPASEAVEVPDEPAPPSDDDLFGGPEALAKKDLGHMLGVLTSMRLATKGSREFVVKSERGTHWLKDSVLLKRLGSVNEHGIAVAIALKDWERDAGRWLALCNEVAEEATMLGVAYLD